MAVMSPIQKQIQELEERCKVLDLIVSVVKTPGGHLTDDGKNLYFILKNAGLKKSEIARVLHVTPSALTKFE